MPTTSPDSAPSPTPPEPGTWAPPALGARSRAAMAAGRCVAWGSRRSGLGGGSVIGGRAALAVDPRLLARLAGGRRIALVSATNGKTTTCHLLAAAARLAGPVASNAMGANMGPGIVAALAEAPDAPTAVLEVDERWLPGVLADVGPAVVVLGNLSRDQLDRTQEVRSLAEAWRDALGRLPVHRVVANADDPLVAWAAAGADPGAVTWVAPGSLWTLDATGCPACAGRIAFADDGWACQTCDLRRPTPDVAVADGELVWRDGARLPLDLGLPGRANRANAALAVAAAEAMGLARTPALDAVAGVDEVAGRYRTAQLAGARVRLLLAKNPAGWQEAIDMLGPAPRPVVAGINARIADGRDPSWLWDVPYERMAGRTVVAVGERRHDLAVRLRYAEVDHRVAADLAEAVALLRSDPDVAGGRPDQVDYIGNYTAFQDELDRVGR